MPERSALPQLPVRIDLKVFAAPTRPGEAGGTGKPGAVEPADLIPVFHDWIRQRRVDGLLIDVADYSHVHHGPGVLLIGHQAQYHYDLAAGRPGLLYSRRRRGEGDHSDYQARGATGDLHSVFRQALAACQTLEEETALAGRLTFPGDELMLRVNDRLALGSGTAGRLEELLLPALQPLLAVLYPGAEVEVEVLASGSSADSAAGPGGDLPALRLRTDEAPGVATLLARLKAAASGDFAVTSAASASADRSTRPAHQEIVQ